MSGPCLFCAMLRICFVAECRQNQTNIILLDSCKKVKKLTQVLWKAENLKTRVQRRYNMFHKLWSVVIMTSDIVKYEARKYDADLYCS